MKLKRGRNDAAPSEAISWTSAYLRQAVGRYFGSTVVAALVQDQEMLPALVVAEKARILFAILLLALALNLAWIWPFFVLTSTPETYLPRMLPAVAKPAEALAVGKRPVLL